MKKIIRKLVFFFFLGAVALNAAAQGGEERLKLGDPMPEFTLDSEIHGKISSADLKGKVVLISLFATWCPPCQQELAEVQRTLYPRFRADEDFRLLVVGREHTDAELVKYNERKKFAFPLYPDPGRNFFSLFAEQTIPRTYLFGKDGALVYAASGYSAREFRLLMEAIEKAL